MAILLTRGGHGFKADRFPLGMAKSSRRKPLDSLTTSPLPIYLVGEDSQIEFATEALAEWVGIPLEQVVGEKLGPATGELGQSGTLRGLNPPPEAGTTKLDGLVSVVSRDGRLMHRRARFVPLRSLADAGPIPLLVFVEATDLSATELAESMAGLSPSDRLQQDLAIWRVGVGANWPDKWLVGQSPAITTVRKQMHAAQASRVPTLITGICSGDLALAARTLHHHPRSRQPSPASLLTVDGRVCSAGDLEAVINRAAEQSTFTTLMIEHCEQLEAELQQRLATRVASLPEGVHVVATAEDHLHLLPTLAKATGIISIELAPLGQRSEDIPQLTQAIVEDLNSEKHALVGVTPPAIDMLAQYSWPGGFAELQTVLSEAHAVACGTRIEPGDLPAVVHHAVQHGANLRADTQPIEIDNALQQVERWLVERALELSGNNKAEAARLLGISRPRLYRRLESLGFADMTDEAEE